MYLGGFREETVSRGGGGSQAGEEMRTGGIESVGWAERTDPGKFLKGGRLGRKPALLHRGIYGSEPHHLCFWRTD